MRSHLAGLQPRAKRPRSGKIRSGCSSTKATAPPSRSTKSSASPRASTSCCCSTPAASRKADDSKLKFEQLLQTGVGNSGTVPPPMLQRFDQRAAEPQPRSLLADARPRTATSWPPTSPARRPRTTRRWPPRAADDEHDPADDPEERREEARTTAKDMNVIVVADIDWIIPSFFFIREGGDENFLPATQNVTFILNIIDELAGDDRFMEIRKRARMHRTLTRIDEATSASREKASEEREEVHRGNHREGRGRPRGDGGEDRRSREPHRPRARWRRTCCWSRSRMREQEKLDAEVRGAGRRSGSRQIKEIEYELRPGNPRGAGPLQTVRHPDPADPAAAVGAGRVLPPPRTGTPGRVARAIEISERRRRAVSIGRETLLDR